jgi:MATE family multidrug resistance protein
MHKSILKLSIPNILSNITIPIASSIDMALMGHLDSLYLASVALASMIFVFLYGSFNFLRMGTTGVVAIYHGQKSIKQRDNTLYRAFFVAIILATVIFLFREPILVISEYLLNSERIQEPYIKEYFDIRIYSVFAIFLNFAIIGWYFGVSNVMVPLYMTLVINISNVSISYILVSRFDLGVSGAAYGTMISQYLGLFVGLYFLMGYNLKKFSYDTVFSKEKILRFFKINSDLFIRTMVLTLSLAILYSLASKNSSQTLVLVAIILQFMTFASFGIDGFANASESLVGRYLGARDRKKFDRSIRYSLYYGGGFSLLVSLIYLFFTRELIAIFTNDVEVIQRVLEYQIYIALIPMISFVAYMWDGINAGMTESRVLRDSVLVSAAVFLAIFYLFISYGYEFWLLMSFAIFFIIRGLYQSLWYILFFKKRVSRVIVYGDIHGCLDEFKKLRKKLDIMFDDMEIVVGDFLNKGPKSLQTLRYIKKHKISSVMGNNEKKIIDLYHKYLSKKRDSLKKMKPWEIEIVEGITQDEVEYLKELPYFLKVDNLTIVHGGVPLGVRLDSRLTKQDRQNITLLRFYNRDLKQIHWLDKKNRYKFWSEVYDGGEGFVVFGHHPFSRPKIDRYSVGVDTGCVYGGSLHAVVFIRSNKKEFNTKEYKLIEQKSKKNYFYGG